jgi:hypothetical protein
MRSGMLAVVASSLLFSGAGLAQMKNRASEAQLVTRIAYRSTYGADWREQGSPQVCFALYRDRYYRLSKLTENGIEAFQGTISKRQFFEIAEMLKHLVQKRENGIILQGSESLIVDFTGKSDRYTWVDADHQNPFPKPVANIVDWLQGFKTRGAAPFTLRELSDEPICPPASEKPLQPTIAGVVFP